MENEILSGVKMPFCPGCGHGPSVKYVSKALTECNYQPLDVVLVSDIGCSGLVDPLFNTHTIHGLHGRSPALAMGVVMGLDNPDKKVIIFQGDGGATIGLQHLLEASRRNVNMTLVVMNNLIYGMGVEWAKKAADELEDIDIEIIDLRTLVPWDKDMVAETVTKTGKLIVLHEDTLSGGIGAEIAAWVSEHCFTLLDAPVVRVASLDTPVPFIQPLENNFLANARLIEKISELADF